MLKRLALVLIASTSLASAADASRILYSYADTLGASAVAVTDTFLTPGSRPALNCQGNGRLCSKYIAYRYSPDFTFLPMYDKGGLVAGYGAIFSGGLNQPGTYSSPELGDPDADGEGRLTIRVLADDDVVYSYADTLGRSAVYVGKNYLTDFNFVTPVTCQAGGAFCTSALVDPDSAQGGYVFVPRSGNTIRNVVAFEGVTGDVPGTYTATSNGVTARLAIVGPLAVVANVPEPATWGMMILGFGLVGAAARRRRTSGVVAA